MLTASCMPEKSQPKSREHEDYSNVDHQPRPEFMPEEQHIHADDHGHQGDNVDHDDHMPVHGWFSTTPTCGGAGLASEWVLRRLCAVQLDSGSQPVRTIEYWGR